MRAVPGRPSVFRAFPAACGCVLALTVTARAADPVIHSAWRQSEVSIDGSAGEWNKLEVLERGPGIALQNDGEHLYLVVSTNHPELRRQLSTGLILWFDPTAKKAQTFGLRISSPFRSVLPGLIPDGEDALSVRSTTRPIAQFDRLGPGRNERRLVDLTPDMEIALASGNDADAVTYEVKVPLVKSASRQYAVGAQAGATMGLGIETPALPAARGGRGGRGGPGSGGFSSGGMSGIPAGMQGMPIGGGPDDRPEDEPLKPLKIIWTTVRLAAR